jgi:hypothetical protein
MDNKDKPALPFHSSSLTMLTARQYAAIQFGKSLITNPDQIPDIDSDFKEDATNGIYVRLNDGSYVTWDPMRGDGKVYARVTTVEERAARYAHYLADIFLSYDSSTKESS